MASVIAVTLIVNEPSAVARRMAEAYDWKITQDFGAFAEVTAGDGALVWLNVPSEPTAQVEQGVIIHCQVDDVTAAADRARAAGATILREPTKMDFGMESAWAQTGGGPIVDLTRTL